MDCLTSSSSPMRGFCTATSIGLLLAPGAESSPTLLSFRKESPLYVEPRRIQQEVALVFGFTASSLRTAKRDRPRVEAKHCAMWLCRKLTPLSFQEIAREFCLDHHTTVMHACNRVNKLIATSDRTRSKIVEAASAMGVTLDLTMGNHRIVIDRRSLDLLRRGGVLRCDKIEIQFHHDLVETTNDS